MLDTIREFGAEKLAAAGIGDGVRGRLLARYVAKARYFTEHMLDDDQLDRLRELRAEDGSVRAALEWGLGPDAPPGQGAELAEALYPYWHATGLYQEGRYWVSRALDQVRKPSRQRAALLGTRCGLETLGARSAAIPDGRAGVRMADEAGDERTAGRCRVYLLSALTLAGEFDEALGLAAEADRLLTAAGDSAGLVWLAMYLANLHQLRGDFAESLQWYDRGIIRLGQSRERWMHGWLYLIAGYSLAQAPDRWADALIMWQLAIQAKFDMGDLVGVAFALEAFALLAYLTGRLPRAAWLVGAAEPLWQRAGARLGGNPTWEDLHVRLVAENRDAVSADRFDELFAAGGKAPLHQAVAFAISDDAEPPRQRADVSPGPLTRREREIASLAAEGLSSRDIAERLVISRRTVDAHLDHVYAKLGISSRAELPRWLTD
jgi:non-specific serine/threonine protein kinase